MEPVDETVAIPELTDQVPPAGADESAITEPTQTAEGPVIAVGVILTVTSAVSVQPAVVV
jgi:hypothetical protein